MTGDLATCLKCRGLVSVSGPDAQSLLDGLLTSDIPGPAPGTACYSALLTPQGKLLFAFLAVRGQGEGDTILLDVDRAAADDLVKRLMFYRLRAKAEIALREDLSVIACWNTDTPPAAALSFRDPRLAALGYRAIVDGSEVDAVLSPYTTVSEADYEAHRVELGVAEFGRDFGSGDVFAHEACLDQFGGVDFDKGCYVGQEVVSRMHHRGTARSRFVPVAIAGEAPPPDTAIEAGGRQIGTMGSASGTHGIAKLRLDRMQQALAAGTQITAGAATLQPLRPDWATFDWPQADRSKADRSKADTGAP